MRRYVFGDQRWIVHRSWQITVLMLQTRVLPGKEETCVLWSEVPFARCLNRARRSQGLVPEEISGRAAALVTTDLELGG